RPELQLRGLADHLDGAVAVLDARQRDDDEVALPRDLRFGDAEAVDAPADDGDGLVELRVVGLLPRCQHHRRATLQVQPQLRRMAAERERVGQPRDGENGDEDEGEAPGPTHHSSVADAASMSASASSVCWFAGPSSCGTVRLATAPFTTRSSTSG